MSLIAKRLQTVKPSPTLAVAAKAKELAMQGLNIISLAAGEPDFDTPDNIKLAAIEGIKNAGRMGLNEGYSSSSGGLKATVYKNRYNQITFIKLEFVFTEWDAGED